MQKVNWQPETGADSEKRLVPEKWGVATAIFSIIHYLALGENEVMTDGPLGIGHDRLARGFLGHPGARQVDRGSVVTAALGVGWWLTPPQPPRVGSAIGRILGI